MALLSPNFEIIEKDFTEEISAESTTVGATAGVFSWGAVHTPQFISSETALRNTFFPPNDKNYHSFYNVKNFLDYSTGMWVTRTGNGACRNAVSGKSGGISSVEIQTAGSGYTAEPIVVVSNPENRNGTAAVLKAVLTGGAIATHEVLNGGSGYSIGDLIVLSKPEETVDTFEDVSTVTNEVTSVMISSIYVNAVCRVTSVNEQGSITSIDWSEDGLSRGMGYINTGKITYKVYNGTGNQTSSGVGLNITFAVAPSSIKRIDVITGGSGYTDTQQISVQIETDPDVQPNGVENSATAVAVVSTSGTKIYNIDEYNTKWSNNNGVFGSWAAKYPSSIGNSIAVSMCDSKNWSTAVNGSFFARSTVESNEDDRELIYVRRVVGKNESFDNEVIDGSKALSTIDGKFIGYIDSVIDSVEFRKITLTSNTSYDVQIDQHIRTSDYTIEKQIVSVSRETSGVVTLTTLIDHDLKVGQYISVEVPNIESVNVKNAIIVATTNTTIAYLTENYSQLTPTTVSGWIKSKSMGQVNGFVKYFDEVDDEYKLSKNQFYVTLAQGDDVKTIQCSTTLNDVVVTTAETKDLKVGSTISENQYIPVGATILSITSATTFIISQPATGSAQNTNTKIDAPNEIDWEVGKTVLDENGKPIGIIGDVEKVQTILMSSIITNDVFGESAKTEWKYKNQFSTKPTTTSFAISKKASNDALHVVVIDADGGMTGVAGKVMEKFTNLSKAKNSPMYFKDKIASNSKWVWSLDNPKDIETDSSKADWGTDANTNVEFKNLLNATYDRLDGGVDTLYATTSDYVNAYELYASKNNFEISAFILGYLGTNTTKAVGAIITKRGDAIGFTSPPLYIGSTDSIALAIKEYRNTLGSTSFLSMDSGWKYQYDKYSGKYRWVATSADAAGTCAYTDLVGNVWDSPAGLTRGVYKNVVKLAFSPNETQCDILYPAGVNPVVTFKGEGTCLFGDKTLLNKNSALNRIPTRRLFSYLETKIGKASRRKLFENNTPFTRSQFIAEIEPFLRNVKGQNGIDDFLVKCDETNNTPTVINNHRFIGDIYIRPVYSINFITLNFIATKYGVDFETIDD